jgi:hypothetical protein
LSNSVYKDRTGPDWPLGFVSVGTPGTPVCIMVNVDANNVNAPESSSNNLTSEYTPTSCAVGIQGYKPGANNVGMVANTGNVYLMRKGVGSGAGNRSDTGAMVKVIPPGQDYFYPSDPQGGQRWSPYRYFLDADNAGEGALVTLYQGNNP